MARYYIVENVTGLSGILPQGIKIRNILESIVVLVTTGFLTLFAFQSYISLVLRISFFILFSLTPTAFAITGLYSMSLFQFLSVLLKISNNKKLYLRLPLEEETFANKKKKVKKRK
jgi:hypothetical protein